MNFIGADRSFDEARTVLFGAPYDSTTSFRPGTRFGPSAMRSESFGIETYSPYQDRDLESDALVHDAGGDIVYSYRPDGNPSSVSVHSGVTTSFGYNGFGERSFIDDPSLGLQTDSTAWNARPNGRLTLVRSTSARSMYRK